MGDLQQREGVQGADQGQQDEAVAEDDGLAAVVPADLTEQVPVTAVGEVHEGVPTHGLNTFPLQCSILHILQLYIDFTLQVKSRENLITRLWKNIDALPVEVSLSDTHRGNLVDLSDPTRGPRPRGARVDLRGGYLDHVEE